MLSNKFNCKLQIKEDGQIFTLDGQSIAGIRSQISVPELDISFDMGHCPDVAINQKYVLITHGHGDHIGSLHSHTFSRGITHQQTPTYIIPKECIDAFVAHDAYKCLNKHVDPHMKHDWMKRHYNAISIESDKFEISKKYFVKALKTIHGVPSQAYCICKTVNKLKDEFKGLSSNEIAKLKHSGVEITNNMTIPILSYTGDTLIEGVTQHEDLLHSSILIMECTYIEENARERFHISKNDILENIDKFKNKHIVLTHLSQRYTEEEVTKMYKEIKPLFEERGITLHIFDHRLSLETV